ncbi:hypothetical protein ABT001_18110 [Streptomyces sp. NPDC002793]|uniref:hypothetical protein n=1 Tax=Streptomyces sp. NPDC002793 TaxID=3154432 RepID=UPI0033264895
MTEPAGRVAGADLDVPGTRPESRQPVPVQRADAPTQALYPVGYGLSYRPYATPST